MLDGLVGEVLAFEKTKFYLRQAVYIGRTVTKGLNNSDQLQIIDFGHGLDTNLKHYINPCIFQFQKFVNRNRFL